jgi:dTDP-4-amino-4,6-dideoxygalactose transaminase
MLLSCACTALLAYRWQYSGPEAELGWHKLTRMKAQNAKRAIMAAILLSEWTVHADAKIHRPGRPATRHSVVSNSHTASRCEDQDGSQGNEETPPVYDEGSQLHIAPPN